MKITFSSGEAAYHSYKTEAALKTDTIFLLLEIRFEWVADILFVVCFLFFVRLGVGVFFFFPTSQDFL